MNKMHLIFTLTDNLLETCFFITGVMTCTRHHLWQGPADTPQTTLLRLRIGTVSAVSQKLHPLFHQSYSHLTFHRRKQILQNLENPRKDSDSALAEGSESGSLQKSNHELSTWAAGPATRGTRPQSQGIILVDNWTSS